MRVILNGVANLSGMLKAAEDAMAYEAGQRSADGTDKLKDMGLRRDGKFYSVRFNKDSVSVWWNQE